MPAYRDAQSTLRIDTLEAKLAEADAALRARDAEIVELRAEIAELRGPREADEAPSFSATSEGRAARIIGGAMMLAMVATTVGARLISARGGYHCGSSVAHVEQARLRAERVLQQQQSAAALAQVTDGVPAQAAAAEGEIDRKAVLGALSDAASDVTACGVPDITPQQSKIRVTFAPSGRVVSAEVQDEALAGTPAGACIAARFRAARVPPFTGASVAVSKTFTVGAER